MLLEAIAHVAHYQIRNRGHRPAAALPMPIRLPAARASPLTLDAEITSCTAENTHDMRQRMFTGPMSTARKPAEILSELPPCRFGTGERWAFRN